MFICRRFLGGFLLFCHLERSPNGKWVLNIPGCVLLCNIHKAYSWPWTALCLCWRLCAQQPLCIQFCREFLVTWSHHPSVISPLDPVFLCLDSSAEMGMRWGKLILCHAERSESGENGAVFVTESGDNLFCMPLLKVILANVQSSQNQIAEIQAYIQFQHSWQRCMFNSHRGNVALG